MSSGLRNPVNAARLQALAATYVAQAAWFIDPANGSDANDGASATPLKTLTEWVARIAMSGRPVNVAATVTVVGDLAAGDSPSGVIRLGPSGSLAFVGAAPAALATGTFTSVTVAAPATNVAAQVTDSSKADAFWASYVDFSNPTGKRIKITSGARSGAVCWPAKNLAAKNVRISSLFNPTIQAQYLYAISDAVVADPYTVEQLVKLRGGSLVFVMLTAAASDGAFFGAPRVTFRDLCFSEDWTIACDDSAFAGNVAFYGCDIGKMLVDGGYSTINCRMMRPQCAAPNVAHYGGLCIASGNTMWIDSRSNFVCLELRFMVQGNGSNTAINVVGAPYSLLGSLQIWDCLNGVDINSGSPGTGFEAFLSSTEVFGSGSSGKGVVVRPGTLAFKAASGTFKLTGAGGDVVLGSTLKTWAQLPFIVSDIAAGSGTTFVGLITR